MKENNQEKYKKNDGDQKVLKGSIWLQLELSRFFSYFALLLMSLERVILAKVFGGMPVAAVFAYPFISLPMHSKFISLPLVVAS